MSRCYSRSVRLLVTTSSSAKHASSFRTLSTLVGVNHGHFSTSRPRGNIIGTTNHDNPQGNNPHRFFSSKPYNFTPSQTDEEEILLFQRIQGTADQMRSIMLMRSGLVFSCFHTCYWIWYTTDFLPLVNASQAPDYLHVDPTLGYVGIAFAAAIQAVFFLFPKRMVSAMTWRPGSQKIVIYTHRLPWIRPADKPTASYPTGTAFLPTSISPSKIPASHSSSIEKSPVGATPEDEKVLGAAVDKNNKNPDRSILDPSSEQAAFILNDLNGDMTKYNGNLPIGYKWPYYLLDIQSKDNVPEPELLLEALLRTQYMGSAKDYLDDDDELDEFDGNRRSNKLFPNSKGGKARGGRESKLRKITKRRRR